MIKSSYTSSGFTVVKFSCKIAIFFSLSQPAGLKAERKGSTCFSCDFLTAYRARSGSHRTPGCFYTTRFCL